MTGPEHDRDRTERRPVAGGFFMMIALVVGIVIGIIGGELSIGMVAGLLVGIAIAVAIWFVDSRRA